MKPWFRAAMVIAVLAPVAGCSFYFGDDDCKSGDDIAGIDYRNPETNACEYWGGSGGCGLAVPTAGDFRDEAAAAPDWALCSTGCEALDEQTCLITAECRATYSGAWCPPWADCAPPATQTFNGCVGVAPSGPVTGGDCWGLDAYTCSQHNDCAAVYNYDVVPFDAAGAPIQTTTFVGCEPEPGVIGCYSNDECPDGYVCTAGTDCTPPPCGVDGGCGGDGTDVPVCYGQCVPSTSACDAIDCGIGYHCEERCSACDDPTDPTCAPTCTAECVPDYNTCDAIDCGPGYECQEICYPCDPLPDGTGCEDGPYCQPECVPVTPPTCDGIACTAGSHCELQCYPGPDPTDPTMDECYPVCVPDDPTCGGVTCAPGEHCVETCSSGPCTPDACPPPVCTSECVPDTTTACEALTSEADCTARPDCVPVYTGDNCTCYPWGCVCDVLTYERCETGLIVDPATGVSSPSPRVLVRRP